MYLLGYDIGSSFIKASLLEAESGKVIASASYPRTEMAIISSRPGWAEQEPDVWWNNCKSLTRELLSKSKKYKDSISAIGISYQMHGLVIVDKNLKVLRPSIIWCDSRAVKTGEKAFLQIGKNQCFNLCLNSPGNFTASKLSWVKENEPATFRKIFKIMLPGDFIAMKMTGEVKTTPSGLSEAILWDYKKEGLAKTILDHFAISPDVIPEIVPTFSFQGELSQIAAKELNLKSGIPICYRAGDQPNNALSLNVLNPGEVAATCGTSGVVYGVSSSKVYDSKSRINTFLHVNHNKINSRYGVLMCINGAGSLNKWLRMNVSNNPYSIIDKEASSVPAGALGLSVLPFGNGAERKLENKNICASVSGLDFNIHSRKHILRASHESIAFAMNYGMDILREIGVKVENIRAGNANMFLGPVFTEALASVSGASIELFNTEGSKGAAIGAGIGAGIYKNFKEAFKNLKSIKKIAPEKNKAKPYIEAYQRWKKILSEKI